jgi:hypothetical protein
MRKSPAFYETPPQEAFNPQAGEALAVLPEERWIQSLTTEKTWLIVNCANVIGCVWATCQGITSTHIQQDVASPPPRHHPCSTSEISLAVRVEL